MEDKTKKELVILAVLSCVLIALLYAITMGPLSDRSASQTDDSQETAESDDDGQNGQAESKPTTSEVDAIIEEAQSYILEGSPPPQFDEKEMTDVFARPDESDDQESTQSDRSTTPPEPGKYRCTAILWDSRNPMAVINGTVVHEKESIGEAQVARISPNSVTLSIRTGEDTEQREMLIKTE